MKLWLTNVSGNSYKIRVLKSILNVPCEEIYIDATKFEHKQRPIIDMNPRGQVNHGARAGQSVVPIQAWVTQGHGAGRWTPVRHQGAAHKAAGAGDHKRGRALGRSGGAHQENSRAFMG